MRTITLLGILFLAGAQVLQAQRTITGTVVDVGDKLGIPGVQVVVKGTTTGTTTDVMGKYSLGVSNDATHLEFRFMGMKTQEVAIESKTTIDVVMEPDALELETFEIVTYGTARKVGTMVGSAQQVTSATLQAKPVGNVMDALQGQVAGLSVFTNSGDPAAVQNIRLHGVGSLFGASSAPLYVVDGVQVSAATVLAMNPNDFESITTLKDASATSIYGSRAANGVIVIMTKRGQRNQDARVTVRTQWGVSKLANRKFYDNLMSSQELADFYFEIDPNNFNPNSLNLDVNTDWMDVFMRDNVPTSQTDVSVSGGSEKTMYFVSGSHFSQEGTAWGSSYKRFTGRVNVESQAKDWLKVGANALISRDNRRSNEYFGGNNVYGGLSFLLQPWFSPTDSTGKRYDEIPGLKMYHPEYVADNFYTESVNTQLTGGFFVEITPFKGLKIINRSGTDARDWYSFGGVKPSSLLDGVGVGSLEQNREQLATMTTTNTIEYAFDLNEEHSLSILGGQEGVLYNYHRTGAGASDLTDDRLYELHYGNAQTNVVLSGSESYAYLSFFGRLDYAYNDRFFADVSLRNDASSRFGKSNRNAVFWSVGGMWNMINENFIKNIKPITGARFKVSYGTQGNSAIGNYDHLALTGSGGTQSYYNGEPSFTMTSIGNPNLTWEKQSKLTIGANMEFLKKYTLELAFYQRNTSSMLTQVPYPYTSGISYRNENTAEYRNTGIDLNLGMNFVRTKDYFFSANVVFNYNRDKVVELFDGMNRWENPGTGVVYVVGSPVMFYYPIFAKIDANNGKTSYYKPGNNIDETTKNNGMTQVYDQKGLRQNTGMKREVPINGGFGLQGGWKGITVAADFAFVIGKWMFDNTSWYAMNPREMGAANGYLNLSRDVLDYWKQPGDDATFPNWKAENVSDARVEMTTFFLDNASFLRLKNLTISYNFESKLLEKTKFLSAARIFFTTRNLLTFTNFMGIDPEVDANLSLGTYGNSKQFQFGVELKF